jgi:hypothetical protein
LKTTEQSQCSARAQPSAEALGNRLRRNPSEQRHKKNRAETDAPKREKVFPSVRHREINAARQIVAQAKQLFSTCASADSRKERKQSKLTNVWAKVEKKLGASSVYKMEYTPMPDEVDELSDIGPQKNLERTDRLQCLSCGKWQKCWLSWYRCSCPSSA